MKRDSFDEIFDQMQNVFNDFQDMSRDLAGFSKTVPVDVREEDGRIVVRADLPGVSKEDINLKADQDTLEISAESSEEMTEENEKYFRRERSSRSYRRTVMWPAKINPDTIHAQYEDGVLEVSADKAEGEGSRHIDIE